MTPEETIDIYASAWSEQDDDRRRQILDSVLTASATYTDPRVHAPNIAALSDHIAGILASRPGAYIERISAVDMHHNKARFAWHLVMPDGTSLPPSIDIVEFDHASGKLISILGFFGPLADRD